MLTTFTLLVGLGLSLRLALSWALRRHFNLVLSVPQILAGVLIALATLPDWAKPLPYPLPLSLTVGALLPDFLIRRGQG